jgi:hypothetical protein
MNTRNVANMDEIALEMRLEQHDHAVVHGPIDEVVDQEIDPHPRRHAEHRRQAQAHGIAARQDDILGLDLVAAVERYRAQRRIFGAELVFLADPIAAVGDRHDDALVRRQHLAQSRDGVAVGRGGGDRIPVAERRPDQRRQRKNDVGLGHQRLERRGRA